MQCRWRARGIEDFSSSFDLSNLQSLLFDLSESFLSLHSTSHSSSSSSCFFDRRCAMSLCCAYRISSEHYSLIPPLSFALLPFLPPSTLSAFSNYFEHRLIPRNFHLIFPTLSNNSFIRLFLCLLPLGRIRILPFWAADFFPTQQCRPQCSKKWTLNCFRLKMSEQPNGEFTMSRPN